MDKKPPRVTLSRYDNGRIMGVFFVWDENTWHSEEYWRNGLRKQTVSAGLVRLGRAKKEKPFRREYRFHENGNLASEATWVDDFKKHGAERLYDPDNTLRLERHFKNGRPSGPYKEFDENGALVLHVVYGRGAPKVKCDETPEAQRLQEILSALAPD